LVPSNAWISLPDIGASGTRDRGAGTSLLKAAWRSLPDNCLTGGGSAARVSEPKKGVLLVSAAIGGLGSPKNDSLKEDRCWFLEGRSLLSASSGFLDGRSLLSAASTEDRCRVLPLDFPVLCGGFLDGRSLLSAAWTSLPERGRLGAVAGTSKAACVSGDGRVAVRGGARGPLVRAACTSLSERSPATLSALVVEVSCVEAEGLGSAAKRDCGGLGSGSLLSRDSDCDGGGLAAALPCSRDSDCGGGGLAARALPVPRELPPPAAATGCERPVGTSGAGRETVSLRLASAALATESLRRDSTAAGADALSLVLRVFSGGGAS